MFRFRRLLYWSAISILVLALGGGIAAWIVYSRIASILPDVQQLRHIELQEPLYVYASDGRLIALFGETRRYPIRISEVPERLKQAFLATEDARFYQHGGVDYRGVGRAVWQLATTWDGRRVSGGSTITQQVARQFFLSQEYKIKRKLLEMLLAIRMERELSKDEIFELYLNKSFFGNRSYGVAAAAEFYYGKTLDKLDLDEMASLAAIPKFPSSGNPISNPVRARERRDVYVLERMRELGFISAAEATKAKAVEMHAKPHERPVEVYAPYVAEMVRQEMIERYGGDVLTRGYHVTTTIDPKLQAAANQAVIDGLTQYDHRHGWRKPGQRFELADGDTPEEIAHHLDGIASQSGLLPAIVISSGEGGASAVLRDARVVALDADSSRWTKRAPSALLERGDLIRVRRVEVPQKPGSTDAPGVHWQLDQLPRAQATLVSLQPVDGRLKALVGGFSFAGSSFNRTIQARRQPGSNFKPFIYAAAFEKGFHPASIVLDAPVVFRMGRNQEWRPQNNTGDFVGPMRLREALVQSRNLVSVRLLDAIGVDYARRYISQFGFKEEDIPPNLSISLGTPSLTPLEIARGYAVFANGGFRVEPWFIDEIRDRDGQLLFKEHPAIACPTCKNSVSRPQSAHVIDGFDFSPAEVAAAEDEPQISEVPEDVAPVEEELAQSVPAPRAIDARIAWQLASMMRDVAKRGTGAQSRSLGRDDIGGKTGTTNDYRDAWFSGFGGNLVTSVWVGRDDNQSLGYREYGSRSALPIWIDYMKVALKDVPQTQYPIPPGMTRITVNAEDGRLLTGSAMGGIAEYIKVEDLSQMKTEYNSSSFNFNEDDRAVEDVFDIF